MKPYVRLPPDETSVTRCTSIGAGLPGLCLGRLRQTAPSVSAVSAADERAVRSAVPRAASSLSLSPRRRCLSGDRGQLVQCVHARPWCRSTGGGGGGVGDWLRVLNRNMSSSNTSRKVETQETGPCRGRIGRLRRPEWRMMR